MKTFLASGEGLRNSEIAHLATKKLDSLYAIHDSQKIYHISQYNERKCTHYILHTEVQLKFSPWKMLTISRWHVAPCSQNLLLSWLKTASNQTLNHVQRLPSIHYQLHQPMSDTILSTTTSNDSSMASSNPTRHPVNPESQLLILQKEFENSNCTNRSQCSASVTSKTTVPIKIQISQRPAQNSTNFLSIEALNQDTETTSSTLQNQNYQTPAAHHTTPETNKIGVHTLR